MKKYYEMGFKKTGSLTLSAEGIQIDEVTEDDKGHELGEDDLWEDAGDLVNEIGAEASSIQEYEKVTGNHYVGGGNPEVFKLFGTIYIDGKPCENQDDISFFMIGEIE